MSAADRAGLRNSDGTQRTRPGGEEPDGEERGGEGRGGEAPGREPGSKQSRCERIEQLITQLVQAAPIADTAVVEELVAQLHRVGSPLARSIARVVELVAEQLIAPGVALPPLAMACATLSDGVRGTLGARELEAARYEIETLLPMPDRPSRIVAPAAPEVPLSALRRRSFE